MLRARGVDGLILASVEREDAAVIRLAAEGLPVVTVNRRVDDQSVPSVSHDEDDGVGRAVSHLVALGHRRIATIAGPQALSTGAARYRAFRRHSAGAGLAAEECPVAFAEAFNEAEGERCAEALLGDGRPFSAIVCANDRLAIGAIAAMQRHGHCCPDDVSVTGHNDMPMVDRLVPPLTTIRIEQYRAGFEAAELLYALLQSREKREPRHIELPVELIVRGSTKEYCPRPQSLRIG
jgi:LacI family transcriptional regulator